MQTQPVRTLKCVGFRVILILTLVSFGFYVYDIDLQSLLRPVFQNKTDTTLQPFLPRGLTFFSTVKVSDEVVTLQNSICKNCDDLYFNNHVANLTTLLDVKANFNVTNRPQQSSKRQLLLMYNLQSWVPVGQLNNYLTQCRYNNCYITADKKSIANASAVIYHFTYMQFSVTKPPISKNERNPDQPWVFLGRESPVNLDVHEFRSSHWQGVLNWSMTYRLDSDIMIGYGWFETRKLIPKKNYSEIYDGKDKMAAWIVSHCDTPGLREKYVKLLQQHGLQVDIFGRCGKERLDPTRVDDVLSKYKFYLSFENSLCKDYITEKLFYRYNSDLITVVRGGADYDRLLPTKTYINTADFNSTKSLASYMIKLASNKDDYIDFLRRKDFYESNGPFPFGWQYGFCDLCEKVNNINRFRKVYNDPYTYLNDNQCYDPSDLQ